MTVSVAEKNTPEFSILSLHMEIPLKRFQQLTPLHGLIQSVLGEDAKYASLRNAYKEQREASLKDPLFVSYCGWLKHYALAYLSVNNEQTPNDFERFMDSFTLKSVRELCDNQQVPADTRKELRARLDGILYCWNLSSDEQRTSVMEHFQYIHIYLTSLGKRLLANGADHAHRIH